MNWTKNCVGVAIVPSGTVGAIGPNNTCAKVRLMEFGQTRQDEDRRKQGVVLNHSTIGCFLVPSPVGGGDCGPTPNALYCPGWGMGVP